MAPGTPVETISSLIAAADRGDASASDTLFATLYEELRQLARRELRRRGQSPVLGVTTLLHEAYLDISGRAGAAFPDRARFMGYAARVMRGLIIDHTRKRQARKRGGAFEITAMPTDVVDPAADARTLTAISDALDELASTEPDTARVVDLKFFCGFSFAEISAMDGVSERTVQRRWERARLYLYRALKGAPPL